MILLDFLFPPLCLICKERSETAYFCSVCWESTSLLDPTFRCRHCFFEKDQEICPQCANSPHLYFTRAALFAPTPPALYLCRDLNTCAEALAGFALYQWQQLDWPLPDAVLPLPGMQAIAKAFAQLLKISYTEALSSWKGSWECKTDLLEEGQTLLLLDRYTPLSSLQQLEPVLAEAFPKRVFYLSLLSSEV